MRDDTHTDFYLDPVELTELTEDADGDMVARGALPPITINPENPSYMPLPTPSPSPHKGQGAPSYWQATPTSALASFNCRWVSLPGIGQVVEFTVGLPLQGRFARGQGPGDPVQGAFQLWCTVPNGTWISTATPHRTYGRGPWSPTLGQVPPQADKYQTTDGWFWRHAQGQKVPHPHPEFVLNIYAVENGRTRRHQASWAGGTTYPGMRRVQPHNQQTGVNILVVGP